MNRVHSCRLDALGSLAPLVFDHRTCIGGVKVAVVAGRVTHLLIGDGQAVNLAPHETKIIRSGVQRFGCIDMPIHSRFPEQLKREGVGL